MHFIRDNKFFCAWILIIAIIFCKGMKIYQMSWKSQSLKIVINFLITAITPGYQKIIITELSNKVCFIIRQQRKLIRRYC